MKGLWTIGTVALVLAATLFVGGSGGAKAESAAPAPAASAPLTVPANPTGWSDWNQPISWQNFSLPYFAGTRYFFVNNGSSTEVDSFDSPVITQQNPTRVLTAYYVNKSGELLAYNLVSGKATNIHAWPDNLSNFNSPNMVEGAQGSNGTVPLLYEMGNRPNDGNSAGIGNFIWVAQFDLYNDSYIYVNTTIDIGATSNNYGQGAWGTGGWYYVTNTALTTAWFFNVYSHQLITKAGMTALSNWNSPVYVPVVNTGVEDINVPANHTVEARVFTVNLATDVVSWRSLWSSSEGFITGQDENNMPYEFAQTPSGMLLWGIGSNDVGAGSTYHDFAMNLYPTITSDTVAALTYTGSVGTTDANGGGFWDQSRYALNGYSGYNNSGTYQAPFLDPLNDSIMWATNSTWLNVFFASQNFAFGAGPWVNAWSFYSTTTHWEDAVLYDPGHLSTSCSTSCDILLYWVPAFTTEFANTPPATGNPTFTGIGINTATANWTQAPGGGITNDTLYLYSGGACSGSPVATLSVGAVTTYGLSGLSSNTTYSADVVAWNITGQGPVSGCGAFTTLPFVPLPPPGGSSIFALIAGTVALLAVAGTIVAVGRRGRSKRDSWTR